MPRSITLTPNDKGQVKLNVDDKEVVINVGNPVAGGPPGVLEGSPTQGAKGWTDPFDPWNHNTQLTRTIPDGQYSFSTVSGTDELSKALDRIRENGNPDTTHVVRVLHRGGLDLGEIAGLKNRAQSNVLVMFKHHDE